MKLGKAFSDGLVIERRSGHKLVKDDTRQWWMGSGRILTFAVLLFVPVFILLLRLFDLTLVHGHEYRLLADENRTRELIRHAPRGNLLDRTGKPLVINEPRYRLLAPCAKGIDTATGCVTYVTKGEGERLQSQGLPAGTFLEVDYKRQYPYGSALAHLLGYTGELTENELGDEYYSLRGYRAGDRVGRSGAEAVFEERLRGRNGKELVEVDSSGTILRTLGRDKEVAGSDVTLSVDADLSKIVEKAFPAGSKGAVVVSRPSTGEILAMYSSPSFDPNLFSGGMSQDDYTGLVNGKDLPLFNRTIGGVYPPGSTFKIVTSMAALESKAVTPETTIEDTGVLTIGPFSFANWYFTSYGRTEGAVNMVKALTRSNDIYFYKVGEKTGITNIAAWARNMGVGKPQGIELSGEAGGLMPDPAWKEQHFSTPGDIASRNDQWYAGDTYHVAIGQGYLLTTPLAVNVWTNVVANGGKLCRPTIEKVSSSHTAVCRDTGLSDTTLSVITQGMAGACNTGGTGYPFFTFGVTKLEKDSPDASPSAVFTRIPVACKTGTAEIDATTGKTHAWFTVFAPIPDSAGTGDGKTVAGPPELSVTVLVEEAGEGSDKAAPIAKQILEEWFGR